MNMLMLGGLVVVAVAMVIYALIPSRADDEETVRRRSAGLTKDEDVRHIKETAKKSASATVFAKAAPVLSKPVMPQDAKQQTTLKTKLASAGFRKESSSTLFLASKTAGFCVCALIGAVLGIQGEKGMLDIVGWAILGGGLGFMLPNLWLRMTIKKRAEAIRNGLPDSLDLMVIAVESGLGLDAALLRVSDEMRGVHPALAEEFQIATVETQMGVTRADALFKMSERVAVQEMRSLTATVTQAEKLGTSVAKALRIQAESLRVKRRQAAEERAQKTAVKLLVPLILFIFPTIFIVLAGPAAVQLADVFSEGGLEQVAEGPFGQVPECGALTRQRKAVPLTSVAEGRHIRRKQRGRQAKMPGSGP